MGLFDIFAVTDQPDPSDGTLDKPYQGLQDALAQEMLSQSQLRSLDFVRWSRAQGQRHFTEFPSSPATSSTSSTED